MSKDKELVAPFERLGMCYYRTVEFRAPKSGEYFLSGAIVGAYKAANDMKTPYLVVVPTHTALLKGHYERGKPLLGTNPA